MGKFIDLTGQRFGKLTVLERTENRGRDTMWLCICDCGNKIATTPSSLKSGHTKSCGCFRSSILAKQGYNNATHGMKKTLLYKTWGSIKNRCLNPKTPSYPNYGGRGITICDEWKNDFESFHDWALSCGYQENLSIDRIDVNGPYSPENCRWVTMDVQANNKRTNRVISFSGKQQTLKQWADDTGILPSTIRERLSRGWSVEKTLTTPPSPTRRIISYNGETHTLSEWSIITGMKLSILTDRINRGWDVERALTKPARKSPRKKEAE